MDKRKVHLVRKGWVTAACGVPHPAHRTSDPRKVTCMNCRTRTMQLAAAAGERSAA